MPRTIDLNEIETAVHKAIRDLGHVHLNVLAQLLDESGPSLFITVISDEFDGQSHLDRELHIRPAVVRALHGLGLARASMVLEPLTSIEIQLRDRTQSPTVPDSSVPDEERTSRAKWRERRSRVLRALESVYQIDQLEDLVYVATRQGLAPERFGISFASSPRSTTVDLETRKTLQDLRDSQKLSGAYYLSPEQLRHPFANQPSAPWINCRTDIEFLHQINTSLNLAGNQAKRIESDFRAKPAEERGPVITPDVRTVAGETELRLEPFFDYVRNWSRVDGPSLLILMAPAGHGKTTLTMELTRRLSSEFLAARDSASVPLLVPFEDVRRTVDFEALMHKRFSELKAGSFGAFRELLDANSAILVVDGFDELADDAGYNVAENQVRSMRPLLSGGAKVILAGRSVFAHEFGGELGISGKVRSLLGNVDVQTLEILPFEDGKVREFVNSREGLDQAEKTRALEFCSSSLDTEALASNPLFLRIICALARSDQNIDGTSFTGSIDHLVERVCEREEARQHLGIGIQRQLQFLQDLATEAILRGGSSLPVADVRILAKLRCEQQGTDDSVVEKLVDHAFLSTTSSGKCSFIHPLVRDVLAGRSVVDALAGGAIESNHAFVSRDLPHATTQYVARALARGVIALPSGWLRNDSGLRSQSRRNLFQLSIERVRHIREGNPLEWRGPESLSENLIDHLDLSQLSLESVSFDGLTFKQCDFSESLIEECSLRSTRFVDCDFYGLSFLDCEADQNVVVSGGRVSDVVVRKSKGLLQFEDGKLLSEALRTVTVAPNEPPARRLDPAHLREHSLRWLRRVLGLLIAEDGTRFFEVGGREFRFENESTGDKEALERVVAPLVISRLCQTTLQKRSLEKHTIAKHWKRALGAFIQTGQTTEALEEIITRIASKAARYL